MSKGKYVLQYRYRGDDRIHEIRNSDLSEAMEEFKEQRRDRQIAAVRVLLELAATPAANANKMLAGRSRKRGG